MGLLFTPMGSTIIDGVLWGGGIILAVLFVALPILLVRGATIKD